MRNAVLYGLGAVALAALSVYSKGSNRIICAINAGIMSLMSAYFLFKLGSGTRELIRSDKNGLLLNGMTLVAWRDIERIEVGRSSAPAYREVRIVSNGKIVHRINEMALTVSAPELKVQIERERRTSGQQVTPDQHP
jgi:hypothetical protein